MISRLRGGFADNEPVTTLTAPTLNAQILPRQTSHTAMRLFIAICLLTALAGRLAYLCRPFDHDAAMFVYLGKSVVDGDRFCHDIIDNKFPSVGLMTSVCWRAFGANWPAYIFLQTTLAFAGALMLARCAARNVGEYARMPTLLAALVYLNFSLCVFGGFQLETLQIFFSIIAACSAIEAIRSHSLADAFVVGLAAGCAAMLKPTGLAPMGAFACVILFVASAIPGPKRAGLLGMSILGLAIPSGVVLVYLIHIDILRDLPELCRQIALYASQTPWRWDDIFKPITVIVLSCFGLFVRGFIFRRESHRVEARPDRAIFIFAILWLILEMLGAFMQRRMYAYHFLPIAAPAALLFGMLPRKTEVWPLIAALGPMIVFSIVGSNEVLSYPDPRVPILPTSAWILKHSSPGDAVWQDSVPRLLLETNLRPGARFPIMFIFGNHDTAALEYTPIMLADFEKRKPKFIILPTDMDAKLLSETTQSLHLARSPVRAANFSWAWRQVESYVKSKYTPAAVIRGETIWQRKS
jgi:hypothetical protein